MAGTAPSIGTRLAIVSTYLPRRCGIATFSHDLSQALREAAPDIRAEVCALDRDGLGYPGEVTTLIRQDEYADYRKAAAMLDESGVDVVVVQHEYGIFGGPEGAWITGFAAELHRRGVPYLVTLHTVLSAPSDAQAGTLFRLCRDAAAVTVFNGTARRLAVGTGIAPPDRIVIVPHGAPPPGGGGHASPEIARVLQGLEGRRVLSTFGLISPGKGLETAIEALSLVKDKHPDVSYLIAGQTHPEVARQFGDSYRDMLARTAVEAGLEERVVFYDDFLTDAEIAAVLARTDIFCTPYRSREQISSGALTFAVAAGCPVVSTSYFYAEDMLSGGAGIVVPPEDPQAYAEALDTLLSDAERMAAARLAASTRGAALHWTAVARRFADIARTAAARRPRAVPPDLQTGTTHVSVPRLRLTHLSRITDAGGIVQFSVKTKPDLASGYCVDDVARLATVAAGLCSVPVRDLRGTDPVGWLDTALEFLDAAYDRRAAASRNMRDVAGVWLDEPHVGDHMGRFIWSLGDVASGEGVPDKLREQAAALLEEARAAVPSLVDLRSSTYALLGLARMPEPSSELALCTARLDAALRRTAQEGWYWFEDTLTYDNARLPQALLAGAVRAGDSEAAGRALMALDWYLGQVGLGVDTPAEECRLVAVGNLWRGRGSEHVGYEGDEQAIDAAGVVEACVEAWRVTGERRYAERALRGFAWFLGDNRLGVPMYDAATGGCRDGLREDGANLNEGAESTLAYYQGLSALTRAGLVG